MLEEDDDNKSNNKDDRSANKGSLIIVGSGIQAIRHFTVESTQAIEQADKVLLLVAEPITEMWIKRLNPNAESLVDCYVDGKHRIDTYREITQRTLNYVREGLNVCVVWYGHPGVFVYPSYASIRLARQEGFTARMLPGISAQDCLFADLNIDPSIGCQSFEATSFLLSKHKSDTTCHLILWQIGAIGDLTYNPSKDNKSGLIILRDFLKKYYDTGHEVVVYEAAQYAVCKPVIQHLPLSRLNEAHVDLASTLYVPPK